jgi:hypothetical protein
MQNLVPWSSPGSPICRFALVAAVVASGCADGASREQAAPVRDAAFLGSVSIEIPGSEWSSYTALVREVSDATNDSLRGGIETPGWLAPATYQGAIYIPNHEAATLTKYTTDDNGALIQGATLSFMRFGITWIAPVFIAPDKAYLFDDANRQVIVWNPTTMELADKTIDVSPLVSPPVADKPGFQPSMLANYGRSRGERLFVPVRWTNWDAADPFLLSAGLLVIDTTTDTPIRLLQDERLTDTIYTVVTDSQDLYLFTGALGIAHHHVRGNARPGGALRVRSGEEEFDPDFYINLDEAVGGRPASTPVWSSGASVYLKAFHEEQQPIDAAIDADPGQLLGRAAWRYWEVDLEGTAAARELTELPWTSTDGFFYDLRDDGPLFIGVMAADYGTTTLYEATPDGFRRSIDVVGALQVLTPFERLE